MVSPLPSTSSRIRGCLIGGAVGDALGAPIEFASWPVIRAQHGDRGLTEILSPGHFTDDTQMTLFTCEGLIADALEQGDRAVNGPTQALYRSYLHWMVTQGYEWGDLVDESSSSPVGWLIQEHQLHRRESPGDTCLTALRSGDCGSRERRLNDSKGCGGVMRASPAGIVGANVAGRDLAGSYERGCELAAVTHGHDLGVHSAGLFAAIISCLLGGATVVEGVETSMALTTPAMRAVAADALRIGREGVPSPDKIERELGSGWVGEEALGIAIACAVSAADFEDGVVAAANHSGDSDSTGSICGNLLGTRLGDESIPKRWTDAVDALDIVERVADDVTMLVTRVSRSTDRDRSDYDHLVERYTT